MIRMEPKEKASCKSHSSNIDWSLDGRLICVTIKYDNLIVVWDVNTCKKVFTLNTEHGNQEFGNVNLAHFDTSRQGKLLVTADFMAAIVDIRSKSITKVCLAP